MIACMIEKRRKIDGAVQVDIFGSSDIIKLKMDGMTKLDCSP